MSEETKVVGQVEFTFGGQLMRVPEGQVMLVEPYPENPAIHDVVVRHGPHNYTQFTAVTGFKELP